MLRKAAMSPTSECRDRPRWRRPTGRRLGTAGVVAALTCTLACCLPAILVALGVGASAAAGAGHAGHGTGGSSGWLAALLDELHRISPVLLIVSIVLVTVAFALRRRAAALPALLAGVVLYLSVHGQGDPAVMYAGMALGYGAWIALYLWTRPRRGAGSCPNSTL